ncbi:trans-aconitate 2-methyltransferase [Kiloniella laminariae]|uniref:Trans-aconitate 2-methyltransferase n=1 Tax=Kiloniella laminariae TaxID=454162 RepID=A0ABT4LIR7_9PROT|nr:trans-aconitate 2-methyltransferase [Kiloniella laminariae]MCZ4281002.1 trans-aconitate 2-methyltransferase [Kiloniella laminariae]
MTDWDAELYLNFETMRTRPAQELLARVKLKQPERIVDLGCGPGNSTELLVERFPLAGITGLDSSPAMLKQARERLSGVSFVRGDITDWVPDLPVDLIFANASLQWCPDHADLFPRLIDHLRPGGMLAVQMPDNLSEPSHQLMNEIAKRPRWQELLSGAASQRSKIGTFESYYSSLVANCVDVDIWNCCYGHVLPGADSIVQWLKSSGLRPYLDPLSPAEQKLFLEAYSRAISNAYPPLADGRVLLRFPRLFIVATKKLV